MCLRLEKGLTVANTPDPVTAPTANIALGLMLDTARRITECDRKLRTLGKDMKVGVLENLGMPVTGQTLGIIGMGRIGKALAKRANALGMDVIYHNRRQLCIEDETKLNVTYVSKEELLAKADFVSLNAPYTPDTYHILGEEEFKQMKLPPSWIQHGPVARWWTSMLGKSLARRYDSWCRFGCIRVWRLSSS